MWQLSFSSFDKKFGGSRCKHSNRPSVYIIILDSVSSSMAKRSLPKSISFIKGSMDGTFMEFLNRVGVGSKANGFPMAFGKTIEAASRAFVGLPPLRADWNSTTVCEEYLDKYEYHLHQYMAQGYKAMVAQDGGPGVPYYANCKGFKKPQADHLWRPFQLRIDQSIQLRNSLERSCYERHVDMLEYLEKFIASYPGVPKIAQIWPTTLAHDTVKNLYHSDDHFLRFFKDNKKKLDNAFVLFMGDHGPRRDSIGETNLGQYEANNPFLFITVPRNYRNTSIHNQLRAKTHQLMTPYDIHATLMDILKAHVTSTAHGLELSSGFTRWDQYGDQGKCKFGTPFEPFCQCREALKAT
ncbi:unnamed protein product [Heligmosomoides polygyrus]|uniref:Sulfatase domain-containing protein n=1 Tax=Heligmosomoides polygyrus TaxID=6339 RepID=A0A3P7X077_HELPZ|nr:unnamed protein product [Heligmosomoides polygyrus]